jgi:putative peptide maturation system protein
MAAAPKADPMAEIGNFGHVLESATALLRQLPVEYDQVAAAHQLVSQWAEQFPGADARLLVDRPPGTAHVEYDLLLKHPVDGSVALTCRTDGGLPWAVYYGDHWAANFVVSIDGEYSMTVQQALMQLRMASRSHPDLADSMVNHLLYTRRMADEDLAGTSMELQAAADAFRQTRGLHSAEETRHWLDEIRMPHVYFEEMLKVAVRIQKLKQKIADERRDAYFAAHHLEFDGVHLCEAHTPSADNAAHLVLRAHGGGLLAAVGEQLCNPGLPPVEASVMVRCVHELAPALRSAAPGTILGPHREAAGWIVAEIIARHAAQMDEQTRVAVDEAVCREWLAEQRAKVNIRWHWL